MMNYSPDGSSSKDSVENNQSSNHDINNNKSKSGLTSPLAANNNVNIKDVSTNGPAVGQVAVPTTVQPTNLGSMMQGFSKLMDFSEVLSNCLLLIDNNINNLETSKQETSSNIKLLNLGLENHGTLLSKIEVDVTDQRNKLIDLTRTVAAMRNNTISSSSYHQNDTNNITIQGGSDTFKDATKPNLLRSLAEATLKYTQSTAKIISSQPNQTVPSSPSQAVPSLALGSMEERIWRIETALFHQDNVNKLVGAITRIPNDTTIDREDSERDIIAKDSQIKALEGEIQSIRLENDSLRKLVNELNTKLSILGEMFASGKILESPQKSSKHKTPKSTSSNNRRKFFKSDTSASNDNSELNTIGTEDTDEQDKNYNYNDRYERSLQLSETLAITTRKLSNAIDDIYVKFEVMKSKLESMSKDNNIDNPDRILQRRINTVRDMWNKIRNDLNHGLSVLTEEEDAQNDPATVDDDQNEHRHSLIRSDPLISKATAFLTQLEESMASFDLLRSGTETALALFPVLDSLTVAADELLVLDAEIKNSGKSSKMLSDIICLDNTANLRPQLLGACSSSIPILEEVDDKVLIRRRMDKIDALLNRKADFNSLKNTEHDLKRLIDLRVNKEELKAFLDKKASLSDLERLKDILHRKIDTMKDFTDITRPGNGDRDEVSRDHNTGKDIMLKDAAELVKRFDILHKHFRELQMFCGTFVPRDEVHEAMQAVVNEVKVIRSSAVTIPVFKDALKLKADNEELQRLISTLSSAIGDFSGLSNSSALHAKCLVCDKPVTSLSSAVTYARSRSPNHMLNLERDRSFDTDAIGTARMPSSTFVRLNSPDIGVSSRERARVTADVTVLKNSIDLPPINGVSVHNNFLFITYKIFRK